MSQTAVQTAISIGDGDHVELRDAPRHQTTTSHLNASPPPAPHPRSLSLPPADTGPAAYRLLAAAFVFEALLWGFPLSYGVFQAHYSTIPTFASNPYISVVGSIASGISYIAAPLMIPLAERHARYRRHMILIGWPLALLGLGLGSFATDLGTLIFTQAVMYGVGFVVFYYPILSMVNEFWVARRGMAYGVLCSASGLSGAVFPFVIERMLAAWGYQTTLRAVALGLFVLTAPFVPFLKGRLPPSEVSVERAVDWSFLKVPHFWLYSTSNFFMGLGYFFPGLYLPSYALSEGISSTQGAVLLAVMSCAQVVGQLSFGYLSDKKSLVDVLAIVSTVVAAVTVYAFWGLSRTFSALLGFALLFGFFGAGYTALWNGMGMKVSNDPSGVFMAFALLNLGKGVGNVLAGPIGAALVSSVDSDAVYGGRPYGSVILFTGTSMALSAFVILTWHGASVYKNAG